MGCMSLFGLCERSLVSDLSSKPVTLLALSHFPSTSPGSPSHPSPPARGTPSSLWRWLLAQQTSPPGWGSQCLGNVRVHHIGWSRFSERRNAEKLLFSSLILERRRIFGLYHGVLSVARLANSVGYIYLFSFTEAGFIFCLSGFTLLSKSSVTLKLFVLRVFPWDLSKNPKGWSDCWRVPSNICNHAMLWAAFLKLLEGHGWVHLQENPNKGRERWP